MAKILLVEDSELSRDMLARRLERRGYDVICAEDGRQAIEVVNAVYLSSYSGEKVKLPLDKSPDFEKMYEEIGRLKT